MTAPWPQPEGRPVVGEPTDAGPDRFSATPTPAPGAGGGLLRADERRRPQDGSSAGRVPPSPGIVRAARALGYALASDMDVPSWQAFVDAAWEGLTDIQRWVVVSMLARTLDPGDLLEAVGDCLRSRAGYPPVPLFELARAEAGSWAEEATRDELRCMARAVLLAMSERDRAAVLAWLSARQPEGAS